MTRYTKTARWAVAGLLMTATAVACGVTNEATSASTSMRSESAVVTDAPATTSPNSPGVDPAGYSTSPGYYRFTFDVDPVRECSIGPGTDGHTVFCSVQFPPGTDSVSSPPFEGPPNAVIVRPHSVGFTIIEGSPIVAPTLPSSSEIRVGNVRCAALPGGVDCQNLAAGMRYSDGELSTYGPLETVPSASQAAAPTSIDAPMDHYSDGTEPVAPGTMCGAATGRRVVQVVSGSISCSDALTVMERYWDLPPGDYGNANIRSFDRWDCASPTARRSAELGYGSTCRRDDIELIAPI